MDDERPVLVNALLCFIKNYRNEPNIEEIVDNYFAQSMRDVAHSMLLELLAEMTADDCGKSLGKGKTAKAVSAASIIELFDRLSILPQAPIFATDNLLTLPLSLCTFCDNDIHNETKANGKDSPYKKDFLLLNELRQIRLCVQSALHVDKTASNCEDVSKMLLKKRPSFLRAYPQVSTPTNATPSIAASSPESPVVPVQKCSTPSTVNVTTPEPTASEAVVADQGPSSTESALSTTNSDSSNAGRKKCEGNRLDRAVRKLTDRLELKQDPIDFSCKATVKTEIVSKPSSVEPVSSTVPSMAPPAAPVQMPPSLPTSEIFNRSIMGNGFFHNPYATAPSVDAISYMQMLRNIASINQPYTFPAAAFGQTNKQSVVPTIREPSPVNNATLLEAEDDDKMSNESSPTPSDTSNSRDDLNGDDGSQGDLGDKPFACAQSNCHKRFSNKFLLKKHQFIHTGLRPHTCPFCSKRFNRKDNLLRHKKTHISNAAAQLEGRRRHNMLYGVRPEDAATLDAFALVHNSPIISVDEQDIDMKSED